MDRARGLSGYGLVGEQLAFAEISEGSSSIKGLQSRKGPSAGESSAVSGHSFPLLAEQYLAYLGANRRCSPGTVRAYRCDYQKVARLLSESNHNLDVQNISTGDLQVCIAGLIDLSAASIERLIYSLRSLFKWLRQQDIIDKNPAEDLALPQRTQKIPPHFSRSQADKLCEACETLLEQVVVGLLRYCGLRRSELLALNVEDVAADYSSVKVSGKGNKERVIPLHRSLKALLREHIDNLPAEDGQELIRNQAGRRMSPTTFWRIFRRLLHRAGLSDKDLSPHALRHHFGTELVKAGVDLATIAELMGHANISTTSIYLHTDSDTKRAAISKLPGAHRQGPQHGPTEREWQMVWHEDTAEGQE